MPDDFFRLLNLPRRAALSDDEVREAFQATGKEAHPDQPQGAGEFEQVSEAYRVLRDPAARVRHLLALEFPGETSGGGKNMASGELLELFGKAGEVFQAVDEVLKKKAGATTALGKAMIAKEEFTAQQRLQEIGFEVAGLLDAEQARLAELDARLGAEEDAAGARALGEELLSRLAFLTKWQAKVRERMTAFLVSD